LCELKKQLITPPAIKGHRAGQFTKIIFNFLEAAEVRRRCQLGLTGDAEGDYAAADEQSPVL